MSQPPVYLFVYGTLQPGFTSSFAQFLHQNSRYVGEGILHGRLYNTGHYPGAVYDPESSAHVYGTVFDITERPHLLRRLDKYEGVSSPPTPADEYVCVVVPVRFRDRELFCLAYLYNWPVSADQQITSGRYSAS